MQHSTTSPAMNAEPRINRALISIISIVVYYLNLTDCQRNHGETDVETESSTGNKFIWRGYDF